MIGPDEAFKVPDAQVEAEAAHNGNGSGTASVRDGQSGAKL